jgi:hypothetical protein
MVGDRSDDRIRPSVVARLVGAGLVVVGIAHLLVPGVLLSVARVSYDRVLDVAFEPRARTGRRVRLVGLGMVAAGAHLVYHGGVRPARGE